MRPTYSAERSIVQIRHAQCFLYVVFKLVQRLKLFRHGGQAFAGRRFQEHLITAAQERGNLVSYNDSGTLDIGLVRAFIADNSGHPVLHDLDAPVGQVLQSEGGGSQTVNTLGKGGDFRILAAKEHILSIKMTTFEPRLPMAAITDEFSPVLAEALPFMQEIGMTGAELRVVDGKNILDLSDDELKRTRDALQAVGLQVVSIASPLLKCVLPDAPQVDSRFQHDVFASKHTFADQPRLTEHAIKVTQFFGAPLLRVFSYWRTVQPERCEAAIVEALSGLATIGEKENVIIGLENEHACNIGTAVETARILKLVPHRRLMVVWDPANALCAGEDPFPGGYALLPKDRIAHVHAKDCHIADGKPVWGPLGTRHVPWKEQIQGLIDDGYRGYISLETHWRGPNENNKPEGSRICGWNLRGLLS
jgi:sugar phosphate isomerase/epimerase